MSLRGRVLAQQVQGSGFNPQHCGGKKLQKKEKKLGFYSLGKGFGWVYGVSDLGGKTSQHLEKQLGKRTLEDDLGDVLVIGVKADVNLNSAELWKY